MIKILKNNLKKFLIFGLVFILLTGWLFSGWPRIWPLGELGTSKIRIPPEIPKARAAGPAFEAGEITINDSLDWETINLSGSYSSAPVILATPVTANNCEGVGSCAGNSTGGGGGMYPIPLIRNVGTDSFDISMCVDGGNTTCSTGVNSETFHWFAFDVDDAINYNWIEAGTTANVSVSGGNTAETFTTSFTSAPVVWTQAQTYSQGSSIGAIAWVNDNVTTSGFTYIGCTHQGTGDSCTGGTNETFGYVAIDTTNQSFESGINFQSGYADISNSVWTADTFSPEYTSPRVMVTQNDDDGAQDPEYAWARNITGSGMDFRYCEEDDGTTCNTHTGEKTYWFALEEPTVGPATDQLHFRWRDDTTDLNTSGGWLAVEDNNSIGDITKNTTYRLRIESARANGAESAARTYELQWGDKTGQSSCNDISTWIGIADASDEFDMVDSTNIDPDGESTSVSLLTAEGSYTAGEGRDVSDTTGSIGPLSANYYTELEYSFKATDDAVTGHSYCFRLYDTTAASALDSYSVYPEATISSVTIGATSMEWGTETGVSDDSWKTINFTGSYISPVFICTVQYNNNIGNESDGDADSVVCRVQNVGSTSAQVILQEPGAPGSLTQTETIHWLVVEEGEYDTDDIKIEAFTYNSTITDENGSWVGQSQSYTQTYTNPVVLGQVMTYADSLWSVFWAHDGSNGLPTASNLYTGKHVGEDTTVTRNNEIIGVVVIEESHGTLGTIEFEAGVQGQTIERIDDSPNDTYTFSQFFGSTPTVAVVAQAGVSGTDGPHPVLYGSSPLTQTTINPTIMEDEIADSDQGGNTEAVAYLVFQSAGTYAAGELALDQTTYRFYNNADSVQPGSALGNENAAISNVADNNIIRIRMAVQAGLNNLAAAGQVFKLQYGQGSTCSAIGSWTDVGAVDSGVIWRGDNVNTTPNDGDTITASLLNSQINALESYEEENNSVSNPNVITKGSRGEWDWVVQNNGAAAATDYCFRMVLSDGSVIQYTNYPKLTTATTANQAPTVDSITISPNPEIDLVADGQKTVTITATITDNDGCEEVFTDGSITGVFYDADTVADTCSADDNNCYPSLTLTEVGNTCDGAGDYTGDAEVTVDVWFHANPGSNWTAKVTATDSSSDSGSNTQTVQINTLNAFKLDVSEINYGTVNPDSVSSQQTVLITTTGNTAVDVQLSGDDMTWSGNTILVTQQKYSDSSGFDWDSEGTALTGTPVCYELSTTKPTDNPSNQSETIYWKLKVPTGKLAGGPYTATNDFDVVSDATCP